jgi:hypothetical protein
MIFLSEKGYPVVLLFQRALPVFKATFFVALKRNQHEKNLNSVSHPIQRIVYYPQEDQRSKLEGPQSYGWISRKCYAEE